MVVAVLAVFSVAGQAAAEPQDGRWDAEWIPNVGSVASVNGRVTHGDRLSVAVRGQSCDMGDLFFSAYTHYKGGDFLALQGRTIKVRFNGAVRDAMVVSASPFLLGHVAMIDLGAEPLAQMSAKLSKVPTLSAEIVGQNQYFDVPGNAWSTAGLAKALDKAVATCRQLAALQAANEDPCEPMTSANIWVAAMKGGGSERYLRLLKECATGRADVQQAAEDLMVSALQALDQVADQVQMTRQDLAVHVKETLWVVADSGLPSAQHNYAALHNVDPNGPLADLFPVDQATFLKWTRKAAAGKEPRAMFNLAMRLLPSANAPLPADLPLAYILLRQIADEVPDPTRLHQTFGPVLDEQLDAVRSQLGAETVAQLDARRTSFDFRSLDR